MRRRIFSVLLAIFLVILTVAIFAQSFIMRKKMEAE